MSCTQQPNFPENPEEARRGELEAENKRLRKALTLCRTRFAMYPNAPMIELIASNPASAPVNSVNGVQPERRRPRRCHGLRWMSMNRIGFRRR